MASELAANSASIKEGHVEELDRQEESGEEESGEWELAGAKALKKNQFQQSPKADMKRSRRLNSNSSKTPAQSSSIKAKSNQSESLNNTNTKTPSPVSAKSIDPVSSDSKELTSPNTVSTTTSAQANPWAKLPTITPVSITATSSSESNSVQPVAVAASVQTPVKVAQPMKASVSFTNGPYSIAKTSAAGANLDSSDWPSLNNDDLNFSLNIPSTTATTNKVSQTKLWLFHFQI